ncbi:MAG: hypothetical protein AMK73_02945 [Planctomycetes bacterium SM23_32]|nr:MAG: hypothetical protein AMK73_02945 [Planctomycetes bacterium SM23_32]
MRRFVIKGLLFTLLQAGVLAGVYWRYEPQLLAPAGVNLMKHDILERQPSPRLVLVGGSSVRQGTSSRELERALGYHPVNMGLSIHLGPYWQVREIEPYLRPGDVVVISFQPRVFGEPTHTRRDDILYVIELRPAYARFLSLQDIKPLLDRGVLPYLTYVVNQAITPREFGSLRNYETTYGDLARLPPDDPQAVRWLRMFPEHWRPCRAAGLRRFLNRFHERCRARGVRVFFSFPSAPTPRCAENRELIEEVERRFCTGLEVPVLNRTMEASLPMDCFNDALFHVDRKGQRERTAMLIERLSAALGADAPAARQLTEPGRRTEPPRRRGRLEPPPRERRRREPAR